MSEALTTYQQFFPYITPTIYQQELIEANVEDVSVWRKTLEFWAGSGYRPQNVFKMLDHYAKQSRAAVMDSPESIVQALHRDFDDLTNPTLSHIGVLQTLMRRAFGGYDTEPVTSHKYFLPEARQLHAQVAMTELRPATIETVLAVRQQQYANIFQQSVNPHLTSV